ncbi:MAG: MFS transporter [Candidatus Thermoplasmatota archaeon]|nr:MFS transporter [Candidatus Thermoplasmatota archaeon]
MDTSGSISESAGSNGVLASILSARVAYALNWYTTAPALVTIAAAYGVSSSLSGLITSSFLLAVGIFQIPAGLLSSRYGSKRTAMNGLLILSVFSILTPFAPLYSVLIAFRFIAGIGAALFFAPGVGVLSSFFTRDRRTSVIGYYNAAFDIGAGSAILFWPYIIRVTSWQAGIISGGLLSLLTYFVSVYTVRMERAVENSSMGITLSEIAEVLRNRYVWFIALGFVGVWGAFTAVSSYLYIYSVNVLKMDTLDASILSSLILFIGLIGGVLSGPLHRSMRNSRRLMVASVSLFTLSLLLFLSGTEAGALAGSILTGILFTAGVSLTYALPAHMPSIGLKNIPLAVSLVNGIQIMGGFWVPFAFSDIAFSYGFDYAWLAMIVISAVFLPFYLALPQNS